MDMRDQRERLLQEVVESQRAIVRASHSTATPNWVQLHLSMAQLKTLFVLNDRARSVGEVAEALGVGKAAASLLIDRLVQLDLVERNEDPVDRRRTLVHLTAQGEQSVHQLRDGGRERLLEWLGRIDDEDLAALVRGLRALAAAAEQDGAPDEPKPVPDRVEMQAPVGQ